jgi:hypothetical protein
MMIRQRVIQSRCLCPHPATAMHRPPPCHKARGLWALRLREQQLAGPRRLGALARPPPAPRSTTPPFAQALRPSSHTTYIQQITKAAVFYDATAILKAVEFRKVVAARSQDTPSHVASTTSRAASPTSTTDAELDSDGEVGGAWA